MTSIVSRVPAERLADLPDTARGLTTSEVVERRARYGPNAIFESAPGGWTQIARDTVRDPMIWFLLIVGALFAAIGDYTEAVVLAVAIVPLMGMDAWLHRRTQASHSRLATHSIVIRGDATREVEAIELVPGDLVRVSAGEPFPADGMIVAGELLQAGSPHELRVGPNVQPRIQETLKQ